jgi:putative addiction module antidote
MNAMLKVTKVGNSAGVILSKDILAHLDASIGTELRVTKTAEGKIELSASDEEFERQMAIAREVMERRKRALRELAK